MRWRGVWVVVVLLSVVFVAGGVVGVEPFLPGDPVEPPSGVVVERHLIAQDSFAALFVEDGSRSYNVSLERLHGFNVTDSRVFMFVSGTVLVGSGDMASFEVQMEQEGGVLVECPFQVQRSGALTGSSTQGVYVECRLFDASLGVPREQPALRSGNVTVTFDHEGDVVDSGSSLSVQLEVYDKVEPEMHDLLADSSVGAFSGGDALWVAVWLVVAVWAFNRLMLFGGGVALIAAVAGAVPEVGPLFGPEQPALPVVLFIVALVYAAMSEVIQERREEREAAEDPSGGA